jgi:2-polyprenyl-3-methyl-5-hydroxy-6-metoxy-1,4-benzoquinol methylase
MMATFQSQRGRLLDVGCSIGTLMGVAREMDWEVEGLEPNPKAANLAREQGLPIREGFFAAEQVGELPGRYQCVVMSDVIEHVSDPVEALRLAKGLLEPGGFLLVSTPNLESFWCRKFQLKPTEHLFLFSPDNLRALLERQGLQICHLQKTSRRRDLRELNHSTTELGRGVKIMIAGLCRLRLDGVTAWLMDQLFRDELFVIKKKSRRAES